MQIIPAIDLINNKCVRLYQGDFSQKTEYEKSPLEMAQYFQSIGIKRLHLVDLDGAKSKQIKHLHILQKIAANTNLIIDFGGGVNTDEDILKILDAGANYVTIGSKAITDKETVLSWMHKFGADKLLLGIDKSKTGKVATDGWLTEKDETVEDIIEFYFSRGFNHFFCTDINVDGSMQGPSIEWYKKLLKEFTNLKLIASGGVHNINDVHALKQIGCVGAIVGKAIYENSITEKEIIDYVG